MLVKRPPGVQLKASGWRTWSIYLEEGKSFYSIFKYTVLIQMFLFLFMHIIVPIFVLSLKLSCSIQSYHSSNIPFVARYLGLLRVW